MSKISYYITSVIHLGLNSYTNAGMTDEEIKDIISTVSDIRPNRKLWAEVNGSGGFSVNTSAVNKVDILFLTLQIEDVLNEALHNKGKKDGNYRY